MGYVSAQPIPFTLYQEAEAFGGHLHRFTMEVRRAYFSDMSLLTKAVWLSHRSDYDSVMGELIAQEATDVPVHLATTPCSTESNEHGITLVTDVDLICPHFFYGVTDLVSVARTQDGLLSSIITS